MELNFRKSESPNPPSRSFRPGSGRAISLNPSLYIDINTIDFDMVDTITSQSANATIQSKENTHERYFSF